MLLVGEDISLEVQVLNVHATWPSANFHCEWEQRSLYTVKALQLCQAQCLTIAHFMQRYITAWISFFVWKVLDLAKATTGVPSLSLSTHRITSNVGVL